MEALNVESAFQTILGGKYSIWFLSYSTNVKQSVLDIYRIVSSKSLEQSQDVIKPPTGESITVGPTVDNSQNNGGKCC